MGWEAQVSTPYSAYPRKPRPRMKSAMTEYSLRTKQTLQSGWPITIETDNGIIIELPVHHKQIFRYYRIRSLSDSERFVFVKIMSTLKNISFILGQRLWGVMKDKIHFWYYDVLFYILK